MADAKHTQKQIAEKYKNNLDYYRRGHIWRRIRLVAFLIAVVGSIAMVFGFRKWGKEEFFSTGPISANHARFANQCEVCHDDVKSDVSEVLQVDKAVQNLKQFDLTSLGQIKQAAEEVKLPTLEEVRASARNVTGIVQASVKPENVRGAVKKVFDKTKLEKMDAACLKCHEPFALHQPQATQLALRNVLPEISLVHATNCSSCHREHVGHQPMKLPRGESCESCHNDPSRLVETLNLITLNTPNAPDKAEIRDLGDGLKRFVVPQKPGQKLAAFKLYSEGHPPFRYEDPNARDPAKIKYNHLRHEQQDIPDINGRRMTCADCHQPGPDGIYYAPVSYEKHCQRCHSLQIDTELPNLQIPHGDTTQVHKFLDTMTTQFVNYAQRELGMTDYNEIVAWVKSRYDLLNSRGLNSPAEVARRVFLTGDPPVDPSRQTPRSNTAQFFPGCAKCHEVSGGQGTTKARVELPNIAERWVHHGPFTHVPHQHMDCLDCHGQAKESRLTSDILMPSQKLCAECHRPVDRAKAGTVAIEEDSKVAASQLAKSQRAAGGVRHDCQDCHKFHAPTQATILLKTAQGHGK